MAGELGLRGGGNSAIGVTVFTSATLTASANGDAITGAEAFTSVLFQATASSVTGTSPTFDVYVQTLLPDGTTWNDTCHLAQMTTNVSKLYWHVAGAAGAVTVNSSALAAGTAVLNWLGGQFRIRVVVGGTNPSGVIVVKANFFA